MGFKIWKSLKQSSKKIFNFWLILIFLIFFIKLNHNIELTKILSLRNIRRFVLTWASIFLIALQDHYWQKWTKLHILLQPVSKLNFSDFTFFAYFPTINMVSGKFPAWKINTQKIPTHQIPPWRNPQRKIPTQKIPTRNIPSHIYIKKFYEKMSLKNSTAAIFKKR